MLPYGATDLALAFRTVRSNTMQIATELAEDRYEFTPAPGVRTVRQLLVHIAFGDEFALAVHPRRLATLVGFDFPSFITRLIAEERTARSKTEVLSLLQSRGDAFATWLQGLDEATLAERVVQHDGTSKSRLEMVMGVKEHEMHHRGQLMLIERMVGIVPHLTRRMQERIAAASRQ